MPSRDTVMRWQRDNQEFAAICGRAREWQADLMDDMILSAAIQCKPDTANADRVKIDAFKWRAARLAPKRYGDKVSLEHTGSGGGPVRMTAVDPIEAAAEYARLMGNSEDEGGK